LTLTTELIPMDAVEKTDARQVLSINNLNITLPRGADRPFAVEGASLTLLQGRTLCIVGESGSGKSTIADAVMGLLPVPHVAPAGGEICFFGKDLLKLSETEMRRLRGNRIGMVFQEPMTALNPIMRIGDQLEELIDAHLTLSEAEKRRRILAALADVHLPEPERLLQSYPFRLSGGQRQRVVIAIALLLEPDLLIADEPTTALDMTTQVQILRLIRELQQRRNTAVLFITHDFGVVSEIADDVVVMQNGKIVESGPKAEVLTAPKSAYTRKLIAAIPHGTPRNVGATREKIVLEVRDLHVTYAAPGGFFSKGRTVQAVRGVSFELRRGETLGIVGESGSGKSTVGRCVSGLIKASAGEILFRGEPLPKGSAFRKNVRGKIQMIFQDPNASLNPRHRIGDSIAAGPIAQGVSRPEALERARSLLQFVGLNAEAANRFPHEFSGGQRQRVGIARALAMEPELIVADEPVSALDVSVQAQVLELFADVRERFNLAIVFITHDLRVAGQMCDRIAVMQRGEVVEHGETAQLFANPQHPYTRSLIDAVPKLLVGEMNKKTHG
jgi:peptide/nickel transport system ATP-binding protein